MVFKVLGVAVFLLHPAAPLGWRLSENNDKIKALPGFHDAINFQQYSGYLNASDGKFLHYWFVESQGSPTKDPLVLWLNGGPGCSSLGGLLTELGPFHVKKGGQTLYKNEFSWNKVANVIFLESPAGVGFSYSDKKQYATNDDGVAAHNYKALLDFFHKYPQFSKNDFYIAGESYAGIYIPMLSELVLDGKAKINFKGFAIGNGYLDAKKLKNSVIFFWHNHGFFDDVMWKRITESCCIGCPSRKSCHFGLPRRKCRKAILDCAKKSGIRELNLYNVYAKCYHHSDLQGSGINLDMLHVLQEFPFAAEEEDYVPCINSDDVTAYLKQKSVRDALHIPDHVDSWSLCSRKVSQPYDRNHKTMERQIKKLISSKKLRGLIYNGDTDMACNYLGNLWFCDDLGFPVTKTDTPWFVKNQLAGFYKVYGSLTYLTIKGSGHLVPEDKPEESLKMFTNFLLNKPY